MNTYTTTEVAKIIGIHANTVRIMAIFGPLADMLLLQGIMVGSGITLALVTVYLQVKSKLDL